MKGPRQWLSWVAFAAVVVVAVATAGWGNDTSQPRRRQEPAPSSTPSSGLTARAAVSLVERADLRPGDLPREYREVVARASGDLDPGDRLHLCGAAVPSERSRIAGHRMAFVTRDGRRVRTEVAAYRPGGAERALEALRDSAPRCTNAVPPRLRDDEVPSTLALRATVDSDAGSRRREVAVLRSGDVLLVLEVDGNPPSLTLDLSRLLAARLG